jgi:hypothetical protein
MREKTINLMGIVAVVATMIIVLGANGALATEPSSGGGGGGSAVTTTEPTVVSGGGGGGGAENELITSVVKENLGSTTYCIKGAESYFIQVNSIDIVDNSATVYAYIDSVYRDVKAGLEECIANYKIFLSKEGTQWIVTSKSLEDCTIWNVNTEESRSCQNKDECPSYYTCPDGSKVSWCELVEGDQMAGCACRMTPQNQCKSRLPSANILNPRSGDIVSGVVGITVRAINSGLALDKFEVTVLGSENKKEILEAKDCIATTSVGETLTECKFEWDSSAYSGKVKIFAEVADANGGSDTSIEVFVGNEFKNILTFVIRDARSYEPIENARIMLSEQGGGGCIATEDGAATCKVETGIVREIEESEVVSGAMATEIREDIVERGGEVAYTNADGIVSFEVELGKLYSAVITKYDYVSTTVHGIYIEPEIEEGVGIKKVIYLKSLGDEEEEDEVRPIEPPPFPGDEEQVTATIGLYKGWNLISLPGKYITGGGTTCSAKEPIAFVYLKDKKKYVSIQEAAEILGSNGLQEYLAENAFWIYSYESCEVSFNVKEYTSFNDINLITGWNLVPITVDMEGLALGDIEGSCEFKSSYLWNAKGQEWGTLDEHDKFSTSDLYMGVLLKASNACTLGGARLTLPEE